MKNNSDESDSEDRSIGNQSDDQGLEEKETYPCSSSDQSCDEKYGKKRSHAAMIDENLDLNDSDGSNLNDSEYYSNRKFRSGTMYQDLSYKQGSGSESYRTMQHENTEQGLSNSNDEGEEDEQPYHYNKIRKVYRENKTNEDTIVRDKIYNAKEEPDKNECKGNLDGKTKVERMMKMMGYEKGHGLGKHKQGRLEPVQAPKQHGRRGLGHHVPGLEASGLKWDVTEEEIKVEEDMEWISALDSNLPTSNEMQDWLRIGPKKLTIDDETQFCDGSILVNVINSKSVFDNLDSVELRRARTRSNPYETIRGAIFLNRAAVKMANIDKACDFMFTNPDGLQSNELLYFADVCAGPGGFSEYVLWRKKWHAKGFGFTLKNENDFKLADFYAGSPETFHPYYGPKDNGDVFDPNNQKGFRDLIMKHTNSKGVHFMMSDGGFSVEGQENIQEILSKQLYLCQCLVALMIVREKGHFVTKLFDLFTPFSAGLVYLMYRCFEKICIFKPNSSRPANSERYLVCKSKRPGTEHIIQHFSYINRLLLESDENRDVLELVALEELEREKQFVQYLRRSNEYLGRKQIIGLRKIAAYCEDITLIETRQADMRKECLKHWQLPEESRTIPRHMKPQDKLKALLKNNTTFLSSTATKLTPDNIETTILKEPYDWFYMPCGTGSCIGEKTNATLYLGMGRSKVYRYIKGTWLPVDDIIVDLPPNTLVYAEVVYEMRNEFRHLSKVFALHILDAFVLGSEDISRKYLRERHELTKKFCEALWKPDGSNYARIRVKDLFPVSLDIEEKLHLTYRVLKNNRQALAYEYLETRLDDYGNDKPYFIPHSVIFLKSTAHPWTRHVSKSNKLTYVFNRKTGDKKFDLHRPASAEAGFIETFEKRVIWYWPDDESFSMEKVVQLFRKHIPPFEVTLEY
ncbi:cap methyltransferase 1 [Calliopsis andreniformis]|uniref:cap methyltransferase 1 n=1 Tax=Calliopsis andreniformis TaxID=337506 RepID=UPI003FCD9EAD